MITRCNQCSAKFEISAELLQADDATVRCGECLSVFDARAQLVSEDSAEAYTNTSARDSQTAAANTVQQRPDVVTDPAVASQKSSQFAGHSHTKADAVSTTAVAEYAHISEEDLQNAATVVLDESQPPINAAADYSGAQLEHLPSGRVNDGFYSPDLSVTDHRRQPVNVEPYSDETGKIDPRIDTGSLDNTGMEFEHTLALEGVGSIEETHSGDQYSVIPNDVHSVSVPSFAEVDNDPRALMREEESFRSYDAETGMAHPSDRRQEAGLPDIALPGAGATSDDRAIPDDVLADPPVSYDEADGISHRSVETGSLEYQNSEYNQSDRDDPDSASQLRRYVNARGGEVFPSTDTAAGASDRSGSVLLRLLAVFLLLSAGLYAARNTIATMDLPAPLLSTFCGVAGCELPVQKNVEQLELVRHQMAAHKSLENVLVITVDLINRAVHPQPYPVLVVTMANSEGKSVAFRKFQPDEYLENEELLSTLPAEKPVRIKFEIVDPGPEALSSELSFE